MVINRVGPLSCAKIAGVLYALMGILIGAIFSMVGVITSLLSASPMGGQDAGPFGFLGIFAVVVFPIVYGGFGFVGALLVAWLYNLLAVSVGGIEIDVR